MIFFNARHLPIVLTVVFLAGPAALAQQELSWPVRLPWRSRSSPAIHETWSSKGSTSIRRTPCSIDTNCNMAPSRSWCQIMICRW